MSKLAISFNERGVAKFEAAAKAFGFDGNETAAEFALALLQLATEAKKTGRDLAIVQNIRTEGQIMTAVDEILDLKNTLPGPEGKGFNMPVIKFRTQKQGLETGREP